MLSKCHGYFRRALGAFLGRQRLAKSIFVLIILWTSTNHFIDLLPDSLVDPTLSICIFPGSIQMPLALEASSVRPAYFSIGNALRGKGGSSVHKALAAGWEFRSPVPE